MSGLQAEHLTVRYNGSPVLRDVSLQLRPGEVVGLIGPNGAGKSTLLRALLGFVDVEQGRVTLDGDAFLELPLKERASKIAYAAQGAPAHWPLTVERVVELGRVPHLSAWQELGQGDRQAVEDALRATDTIHLRDRIVTSLSGGERAGVFLARAIAVGAPLLLADEPVAALDPYHQLQVMEILRSLANEGKGIVVVLHDLSLAMRFCDRLVLLNQGDVLAQGTPKEVLSEDNISRAYRIEAMTGIHDGEDYVTPWRRRSD